METWYTPSSTAALPDADRVLVLAPHPDDETFGCGATLARLSQAGANVTVCVLTDGAAYASSAVDRRSQLNIRQAETNRALACLGVNEGIFWGLADRGLSGQADLAGRVLEIMHRTQVTLVLAPSLWEIHPDHLATSRAVWSAVAQMHALGSPLPALMFYEVGSPLRPNCLMDCTDVWHKKVAAMQCFESQMAVQDYARHITALNAYRTYTLATEVRFAEAFDFISPEALPAILINADPGQRAMGRWIETALTAAEASSEALLQQMASQRQDFMDLSRETQRQLALHHAERNSLAAQLEVVTNSNASSQADLRHCQECLADAQLQNARVLTSTSWLITAPLRWLGRALAKLKGE